MSDLLTPQQRHKNMAAIHSLDTKPEMIVRRGLWKRGFRYRLNYKRLPGHPDLVLRKYKTCIFINGCFWHGHEGCKYYTVPKTNTEFWVNKVHRNKERDERVKHELNAMGWNCITVWECELKPAKREATLQSLSFTLNEIFLNNHKVKAYDEQVVVTSLAAEEMS
ncbi:MAG: DNA mismatch endonuclease Vsr [Bacteroidaceae bacterium]|jgi:DNA mismatch endonuclease (patch repair protein)|nr:DNA mismatch endonuclease Vsr [Bacteroidaceae bacterium]